jgi:hypothetical protein
MLVGGFTKLFIPGPRICSVDDKVIMEQSAG